MATTIKKLVISDEFRRKLSSILNSQLSIVTNQHNVPNENKSIMPPGPLAMIDMPPGPLATLDMPELKRDFSPHVLAPAKVVNNDAYSHLMEFLIMEHIRNYEELKKLKKENVYEELKIVNSTPVINESCNELVQIPTAPIIDSLSKQFNIVDSESPPIKRKKRYKTDSLSSILFTPHEG